MKLKSLKMYHFVNDDFPATTYTRTKVADLHYNRFHPCVVYIANPQFQGDWYSNKDLNGHCEANILDIVVTVNMILAGSE